MEHAQIVPCFNCGLQMHPNKGIKTTLTLSLKILKLKILVSSLKLKSLELLKSMSKF